MTRIMIIVGSVREGRKGISVAEWARERVEAVEGVEVDFVDLKEVALPLMDEPNHPRLGKYTQPHSIAWSSRVAAADAFILVQPEYNFSYTAPVKNAFDYLAAEWSRKPIGLVSYGGMTGGARANAALQVVLGALGLVPTTATVAISAFTQHFDEDGVFRGTEQHEQTLRAQVAELIALDAALAPLR